MAAIAINFGTGGANLVPGRSGGVPTLADALRDVADDLLGTQVAAIVAANAVDLATALTLVNEIKTKLNLTAVGTYVLKTTKV